MNHMREAPDRQPLGFLLDRAVNRLDLRCTQSRRGGQSMKALEAEATSMGHRKNDGGRWEKRNTVGLMWLRFSEAILSHLATEIAQ
jgi:hypothetical protein